MDTSATILGATTAKQLTERGKAAVLMIGKDIYRRADLAGVACFNFNAAQRLSSILATFTVKDTADVFTRIPPSALAVPQIGAVSLAVLGACFELKGLGGATPLQAWVERHLPESHPHVVTFTSIKQQVAAATRAPGQGARSHGSVRPQSHRRVNSGTRGRLARAADHARAPRRHRAGQQREAKR
jgi:hypothetical protein